MRIKAKKRVNQNLNQQKEDFRKMFNKSVQELGDSKMHYESLEHSWREERANRRILESVLRNAIAVCQPRLTPEQYDAIAMPMEHALSHMTVRCKLEER